MWGIMSPHRLDPDWRPVDADSHTERAVTAIFPLGRKSRWAVDPREVPSRWVAMIFAKETLGVAARCACDRTAENNSVLLPKPFHVAIKQ
jgi:hypothetical protein